MYPQMIPRRLIGIAVLIPLLTTSSTAQDVSRFVQLLGIAQQDNAAAILFGQAKAMVAAPNITLVNIPGASIELIAGSSERFHQLLADFAGGEAVSVLDPLVPYCVIVKNNSQSTIHSVTVIWKDVATSQFSVIGSGVRPGEMVMMAPISGLSLYMAGEPRKLQNVDRLSVRISNEIERYSQKSEIVISLDSVIFQDDTMIGPDVAGKLEETNSERKIRKQLATELLKRTPAQRASYLEAIKAIPEPELATDPLAQQKRLAWMYEWVVNPSTGTDEQLVRHSLEDDINTQTGEIHRRNP